MFLYSKNSQYCLKVYCSVVLFEWLHASILSTDLHCKSENHCAELYKQNHLKILLNSIQDWLTSEVNLPGHDIWGICSSPCQPNVSFVFHKQHFRDWTQVLCWWGRCLCHEERSDWSQTRGWFLPLHYCIVQGPSVYQCRPGFTANSSAVNKLLTIGYFVRGILPFDLAHKVWQLNQYQTCTLLG